MTGSEAALFADYVGRLSGIVLDASKRYLIELRLDDVLRDSGCASWGELYSRARADAGGALERRIVDALSTHETYFFREPRAFDLVREVIAPDVWSRAVGRPLAVWSAGSSTGQEAYSLAMTIAPMLAARPGRSARIVGSDISPAAVEAAQRGQYTALEVARGLDAATLARHFTRAGAAWSVSPALRALCRFGVDNLLAPREKGPFDLIFCRNVLIYFAAADKARVLDALVDRLAPGGALVVGAAECILGVSARVERRERAGATFYALRP